MFMVYSNRYMYVYNMSVRVCGSVSLLLAFLPFMDRECPKLLVIYLVSIAFYD